MSFMKKLYGHYQNAPDPPKKAQDNILGLTHLRKLFAEFRHPNKKPSPKEQEDKLYNMIPLFCKVFGEVPSSEMTEKFSDILQFCSHVSKLMVTEIRRRALNQSTDSASFAIVKFLEIESTEESSNGWMLLTALNLLSSGTQALIDCMTATSLPSTLVKCLYLFFDLREIENGDALEAGCEFTPIERRILLQKIFVQVLVRLCHHSSPAEELARKDDLSLLFSAITSWCQPHNVMWRKSAAEVLMTLSRHGLTNNVTKYIHDKGCVRHCVENMQRIQELSPLELVEMFVTVFCFLKDSSEVSQTLLDDFRSCQGYIYLSEFLLRLEKDHSEEAVQALRNLVLLVGSLTTCGYVELKPSQASSGSLFQMPGFSVPQPVGKDVQVNASPSSSVSVRNIQAFQVLQSVFLKGSTSPLCSTILDVINSIYHQDNANYFILEPQHTLSQFAEKIHLKPVDVQEKFFELVEFIACDLNFVPCKELISISILIKTQHSISCSMICIKTLHKILQHHNVYKDVYREVGMLEVLVTCLHRYAALLKDPNSTDTSDPQFISENQQVPAEQQELGFLVMDVLSALLANNNANAAVFRECGGARCSHNMVPYPECRQRALNIVQQLVLSPGGDDDMGTLLGLMHTASIQDLELKTHILKSLLNVLRESHRTRTVFRKVGGFVYVMSVLVSMEGCLADPPRLPWESVSRHDTTSMLRTVFSTLTVAMRYEPANAKFFASEVRYDSLTEAVRLLGCFSSTVDIQPQMDSVQLEDVADIFDTFFTHVKGPKSDKVPLILGSTCTMLKYLYNMALDIFDRPPVVQDKTDSPSLKRFTMIRDEGSSVQSSPKQKRASTGSIGSSPITHTDQIIVHPGAVLSMFYLLPAIDCEENQKLAIGLQTYIAELLKSMLHTERNQQIMCDAGFPQELLNHGYLALADELHPLHTVLRAIFERLASQSLTSKDLRNFLRLGSPLNCRPMDEMYDGRSVSTNAWSHNWPLSRASSVEERKTPTEIVKRLNTAGSVVPLTRVKCLVSMTTPRDARMHGSAVTPAFVEFDMSAEGFGCLYIPSIAPQGPPTPSVVSGVVGGSDPVVIGGIGTGERVFPPQAGMTYSTWFCVDKFGAQNEYHPVRLLTVVRNLQGREENLICLTVYLNSRERSLIVSTEETILPSSVTGTEPDKEPSINDNTVRFWYPELTQEGQWHHLVLIFSRAGIMKNSSVSMFVDGEHVNTQKLHYISPNLGGGGTASPTAFTSVFAYIGTPPQLRRLSKLTWRQGPCHLLEDIVASNIISSIYALGPTYVGSFQSPNLEDSDNTGAFIGEEKVVFGVHAHAVSQMTIAKIRKHYNKVDSKSIAKQLAMSAHENATPIRILHNSAGNLSGPARSLGAVLMGYLGVRTFCPRPVAKILENVGGASALLGLIAMATDVEGLYAAVKALVCVVKSNKATLKDMDRIRGYQTLAMLYKKKQHLLNSHILHLTFSLIGTVDSGRESSVIPNKQAFEDLLCDLEVWHEAPFDLQRSLYEHFFELLTESRCSGEQTTNHQLMRDIGLVTRLLHILQDQKLTQSTIQTISSVISVLLQTPPDQNGLLRLGQFIVSTLPQMSFVEKNILLNGVNKQSGSTVDESECSANTGEAPTSYSIKLRNTCLELILGLLDSGNGTLNTQMCDEVQKVLGFDWLLLFMQGHVHSSSMILALRILLLTFQNPGAIEKFREGSSGGGWLSGTEPVLKQHVGVMLGLNIGTNNKGQKRELNKEVCQVPGFTALSWLLTKHTDVPEVYFLLMAVLLGQNVKQLPTDVQLNLDAVWTVIFGVPASKPVSIVAKEKHTQLCPDAALVILTMIRTMLNQDLEDCGAWLQEYPVTLMQFLLFLYHNQTDFVLLSTTTEFITSLASTLFPFNILDSDSNVTTPSEEFKPFPDSEAFVKVLTPEKLQGAFLTSHPARKFVTDFLRTLVIDSFSQQFKTTAIIDVVLDASPEHATRAQRKEYQTEIMKHVMDHLLAADVLLGEQAALPIATGASYANMANNVFYFASRVVDKLWQGVFTRESKDVFDFISKLISQAKRKASGVSLDLIYKSLNRTILFQLSRPVRNVAVQTTVLDSLHRLTQHRSLVFGPGNYDQEFLVCLCYCLLQLTEDPEKSASTLHGGQAMTTTWHINIEEDGDDEHKEIEELVSHTHFPEAHRMLANASKRVWEELYNCKKPALEEVFKTQLNSIDNSSTAKITFPDLNTVRGIIQEYASKVWIAYAESERKCSLSYADRIPAQIQSKLQKVGSGVLKLATRKNRKELPLKPSPSSNIHMTDYLSWTLSHMAVVKDLVQLQFQQYLQAHEYMEKYLLEEWTQMENELLRERGLWGPPLGSWLDKWMLDMVEGPCRMRKKMVKNDMFYVHYPYRPDMEDSPLKYKVAMSYDSKEYYERFRSLNLVEPGTDTLPIKIGIENEITQTQSAEEGGGEEKSPEGIFNMPKLLRKSVKSTEDEDLDESCTIEGSTEVEGQGEIQGDTAQETPTSKTDNNQTILRILGEGEKITNIFRCGRIQGLDTAEGLLLFGREHFYVIDGFTMLRTREIRDIDSLPPDLHDPIIPKASHSSGTHRKICSKFLYEDIKEVHKRRYLLQPIAVEVFSADGRNYLLAFPRKLRNKVYAKFLSVGTAMTDNAQQSLSGQKHSTKVEAGSGLISTLIGEKSVTQRWERGEINNFQYLMYLNTLAGRSYNDLMQYPVFPWIIADYESEELDLNDSATFRDLSKPMGAQTENRLKQFKKRYQDWDDPQGETPPYHYGTHYSSAMIVASYLVRMEPFTQHFLKLQGGHFDLADRMFHSVKENWLSASKNNMADVKELIPEFFYLPEFLVNANHFDLGTKQSGVELNDAVLPTWARDDPREFIRAHREALECDYVSAHLNEWIDLIFGYKQQGPAAVDAVNVFHHLFYEGNVDIYNIDDPLKKNATIGFINNFGQIPKQMFKKPHPQKRLNLRTLDPLSMGQAPPPANDKLFFHNVDNLKPTKTAVKELKSAVGQIIHNEKYVLAVEQNKVLMPPAYNKYLAWGFADLSVRIGNYESDKATNVFECLDNGEILCATCPNSKIFITGGTSCAVNVWENKPKEKKIILKQPLYGHNETVTCLTSSQPYNIIVSGSRDRTCIIWDLSRLVYVRQLRGHAAPVAAVCINELTGDIATCAGTYLYIWSINGEEIACVNTATSRNQQILCLAMSQIMEWDSRNVVLTGNSDGVVRMWSIEYVQVPIENKTKEVDDATKGEETPTEDVNNKNNSSDIPVLTRRDSYSEAKAAVERLKDYSVNYDLGGDVELGSSVESESYFTSQIRQRDHEGRPSGDYKCNIERDESMLSTISSISDVGYRDDGFSTEGEFTGIHRLDDKTAGDGTSVKSVDTATEAMEIMCASNISETQIPCQSEPCLSAVASNASISGCDRSQSNPDLKLGGEKDSDTESPQSPSSDFVVINDKDAKSSAKGLEDLVQKYRPKNRNALREGFRWQRQLMFRSKLTMHTAYERKDNKDPAAVTAIAVSKDHKTVYVGDARGRIFSWTVTDQPGRVVADHWIKDDGAESCLSCKVKFSFSERKHHCRNCGKVFCSKCSRFETEIRKMKIWKPVRVCQACYNILKAQQAADAIAHNKA